MTDFTLKEVQKIANDIAKFTRLASRLEGKEKAAVALIDTSGRHYATLKDSPHEDFVARILRYRARELLEEVKVERQSDTFKRLDEAYFQAWERLRDD